jgi:hypothetical protein
MEPDTPLERDLRFEEQARDCIVSYLNQAKDNGRLVFPLVEITEETALPPDTVQTIMTQLEGEGPFCVRRQGGHAGETRWLVRGSAYDVDTRQRPR